MVGMKEMPEKLRIVLQTMLFIANHQINSFIRVGQLSLTSLVVRMVDPDG